MKLKSIFKNTFRTLWHTKARFISILIIVMLGVAMFVGVFASGYVMEHTSDQYFKTTNRSDQIIRSSIGLVDEDIKSLEKNMEEDMTIQATYFEDAFISEGNSLTRIYSYASNPDQDEVNQWQVAEGRLPEAEGEIALDAYDSAQKNYKIGDILEVSKGEGEQLDHLTDQTYEIVGLVNSSLYIENGQRGYTDVGNGSLEAFALVNEKDFDSDVYQQAFIKYPEADEYQSYTEEYENFIEKKNKQVDSLLSDQVSQRAQELYEEGKADLGQAEADLQAGRDQLEEGQEELDRIADQLDDNGLLDRPADLLPPVLRSQVQAYEEGLEDFNQEKEEAEREFDQAEADIEEAHDQLTQLEDASVMVLDRSDDPAYAGYGRNADRIKAIARVFPVFFFIVAILVSLTTMTRMVDEGRLEMGILKSFGYNNSQTALKYVTYAFLAGLSGWLLGLIGYVIFPTVIYNAYGSLYTMPDVILTTYPWITWTSLAGAVLATLGAALFALVPSLQSSPADLMHPKAPKQGKRILLERITPLWNALSFNYKITLRNLFRYKKRMFMTIFGIAGCMALMVMGFGISDSLNDVLDGQFGQINQYDAVVSLYKDADPEDVDNFEQAVSDNELIDAGLSLTVEDLTLKVEGENDQNLSLVSPHDVGSFGAYINLEDVESGEISALPKEGILITEKIAEMKGLSKGDTLEATSEEDETYEFLIEGVVKNYQGHYAYLHPEAYESIMNETMKTNQAWLMYQLNSEKEALLSDELVEHESVNGVLSVTEIAEQFEESLSSLDLVVTMLIIAAALLAFVVLYNLTNVNIGERQKELATIKVLGFYDNEVSMYIFRENIFLTLLGIIFGSMLGALLHQYIVRVVEFDDLMFGRHIHLSSYIYSALLTLLFSAVVMFFMHFKLKKTKMIDALNED
ncbi:MAG: FtsX-like permease family protein [Atopococcus tabaci]|uniref:FtsX-like permease family protein n=1 Tax=Atopococcus tabaci TaxID=269774 RepID=A0AA43ZSQ7_9LACT|nr:FtsX-like permease family protein [Atopococcus tabaci]